MSSIAKKPRSVKGQKGTKKPPRFTIKKDSLGRRYAIDKRTGKRASIFKAEKERKSRKKVTPAFRGIIDKKRSRAAKKGWETRKRKSEAAKKGWETRRRKTSLETIIHERPPPLVEFLGQLIPEGMRMQVAGGIGDRAELYPKVKAAAELAHLKVEIIGREHLAGLPITINTPRFDRLYGEGNGAHVIVNYYTRALDFYDIDQMVDYLYEQEDNDYDYRELYTLYFSPEVA